jgi:hypothetical protein
MTVMDSIQILERLAARHSEDDVVPKDINDLEVKVFDYGNEKAMHRLLSLLPKKDSEEIHRSLVSIEEIPHHFKLKFVFKTEYGRV